MTLEELEARRALAGEGDLAGLLQAQTAKARALLERSIVVPEVKALLSSDGGICPSCGSPLAFDPWSPTRHQCSRCDQVAAGPRHDGHWARAQHLWVAERAAHLATVALFQDDETFAIKARELLRAYHTRYLELPNRDNVLGPSHLFFSTYLESIWVVSYLAAAHLLRERGWLPEAEIEAVNAIADEAAALIGDFNEGLSNRQTWNAAALTAIAVWFGDEELGQTAIEGRTGLLGHLTDGFDDDGMWAEGENYHLFALRGLLIGIDWARIGGVDLLENAALAQHLGRALMAPALTALPDLTFPARKDSRFGVSLAHPAYLECFERGLALLGESAPAQLAAWVERLYRQPSVPAQTYDAYLHDAGEADRDRTTRSDLSWWMLLGMTPDLPSPEEPFEPVSAVLLTQGTAILRQHNRYLAIECGTYGGDHGHPDRLSLTLVADGAHWLADPGTGSYVTPDLHWYRSTLAHNAPRLDGESQTPGEARCVAFEDQNAWGWIKAEFGELRRTVVQGPDWIFDVVECQGETTRRLEVPWHLDGDVAVVTPGHWEPETLTSEFVSGVERFVPDQPVDVILNASAPMGSVRVHLVGGTVLRATAPGRPNTGPRTFHVVRVDGVAPRLAALIDLTGNVTQVEVDRDKATIGDSTGTTVIRFAGTEATLATAGRNVTLGGALPARVPTRRMLAEQPIRSEGEALRVEPPPALDGSFDGFDGSSPLVLDDESHYYRSEEPYQGPDQFAARAYVNWDAGHLYLAADVSKPDVVLGPEVPPRQHLDNEAEDINLDGIQVYYRVGTGPVRSYLIRPADDGGIYARPIPGSAGALVDLVGGSSLRDDGYRLTVALPCPELQDLVPGVQLSFDVVINEAQAGRVRRAGQLAWGGGNGWVYLRGDRRPEALWGKLELIA